MFNARKIIEQLKKRNIHLNQNIITYLICVFIATILWFLNALNQEYTAEISYPVKYINFPRGKHTTSPLPEEIQLEVKAQGFILLGYRIRTSFLPITFNVNNYSNHLLEKDEVFEYKLYTNDIKDKIASQLRSGIELLNISPEEINFRFARSENKKIAIKPVVDYTLKRQYILNQIQVTPDSIIVSGPAPLIDTLPYILTQPLKLKNLYKNVVRHVELQKYPNCTFNNTNVEVKIEVEQFTEARKDIRIFPSSVPDSLNIRLFPDHVNVTYDVGLSKYEQISSKDFQFTVDFPTGETPDYLKVKATKVPNCIKNLSFTPHRVEYILEKK